MFNVINSMMMNSLKFILLCRYPQERSDEVAKQLPRRDLKMSPMKPLNKKFCPPTECPSLAEHMDQEAIQLKLYVNMHDNVYGPLLLAEICRTFCIHFTYMGSGCLFKYSDEQ